MEEFTRSVGRPMLTQEVDGLLSMVYNDITVSGYPVYMIVYFSKNGLEGGTYYFDTFVDIVRNEEMIKCYRDMQTELLRQYGPATLLDGDVNGIRIREMRVYETIWDLPTGHIYLKLNTRHPEPVTVWFSSPMLMEMLTGAN